MTFVPVTPHVTPDPPSPRIRELAAALSHAIREYEASHPCVTASEVRAAIRLASVDSGPGARARGIAAVLLGAVVLAAGVVGFDPQAGSVAPASLAWVAMGVVVVALLVSFVLPRRPPGR